MLKSSLNPIRPKRWPLSKILKILSQASQSSFLANLMVLIITQTFRSSYGDILTLRSYETKYVQFRKWCQTLPSHCLQLALLCLSSQRYFGNITVKFSLNLITTQKIANLQNNVTRL